MDCVLICRFLVIVLCFVGPVVALCVLRSCGLSYVL